MEQFRSLKDHVYDYLAARIATGELVGGDKVSEQSVCDALGVSRTPVREALIQLAGDGFLKYLPRRGFRVKHMDNKSTGEIFETLGPLDGRAAALACGRLTIDDLTRLHNIIKAMDVAIDRRQIATYNDLQHDFHRLYLERCGNPLLIDYVTQLNRFFMGLEYSATTPDEAYDLLRKSNKEHKEILRLLRIGDSRGVQRYVRDVHWEVDGSRYAAW